jgi:hypothetical protein
MIKKNLKIAFRNLWRQRIFSFINIRGLAVGMTACFLVFLCVHFELNYDLFYSANRILVATGILATLLALCTIGFWVIMATIANPVKRLRTR